MTTIPEIELYNIKDNDRVYQKLLLVTGSIGNNAHSASSEVSVIDNSGLQMQWPVENYSFKALVNLEEGSNQVRFVHYNVVKVVNIQYTVLTSNPPYQLAIMIASDSTLTFDALPDQRQYQANNIDSAIKRLRMSAYLWQAFISEQMLKAGFGRRTIRFVESCSEDTITAQGKVRNTADVVVIQSPYTLEQLRHTDIAQQYKPKPGEPSKDSSKKSLFDLFNDALKDDPSGKFKEDYKVAGLVLDSQWDSPKDLVRGHAALGGGGDGKFLGIFGSHTTYAWPQNLEEVPSCFLDSRAVDTRFVADENKGSGQNWNSANIGIGAFLHEVGHSLGLPHTPTGIMSRGFEDLNQAFLTRAPNGSPIPIMDTAGAHFHKTNLNRLRLHPCLALPTDPPTNTDHSPQICRTRDGLMVSFTSGVGQVVMLKGDDDIVFTQDHCNSPKPCVNLSSDLLLTSLNSAQNSSVCLEINCAGGKTIKLDNFNKFYQESLVKIPGSDSMAYLSSSAGWGRSEDIKPFHLFFDNPDFNSNHLTIYAGSFLDGFAVKDIQGKVTVGGGQGGRATVFQLSAREYITRVDVNAGFLVDGLQIFTSMNRTTGWLGGEGGERHTYFAPPNHRIIGLHGFASNYTYSLGIIYVENAF